jgi:hypothetical protein
MDKAGRDRGAAAHLIDETDDAKTKMRKGQTFGAGVKVAESRALIVKAIMAEVRAGREPTIASIAAVVDRSYNTVKNHFFACYVTVIATLAVQDLVKGVNNLPAGARPSLPVLRTALRASQLPLAWSDPSLDDHFRQQALRAARHRRRRPDGPPSATALQVTGKNMLDFIGSGPVQVFRSSVPVLRAA